ncbi:MAG: hypothetical protein NVS9B1_03880 [Candidatus Dormibacteraceae bacterium]
MPAASDRGYSGTPLPRKLGIGPGSHLAIMAEGLEQPLRGAYDVIVFFALTRAAVAARFHRLAGHLEPNGGLWIGWPKRASGIETDLTENVLREVILPSGLVDNKVCAIDERWSGLRFVVRLKDR